MRQPERYEESWLLIAANRSIQGTGGPIVLAGQHPGLSTAKGLPMGEQGRQELPANALPLVRRRHPYFIDPQFRRLVRVHVMHRRGHAHDLARHHRDGEMVPRIIQKLRQPGRMDGVIEHILCHAFQHLGITRAQQTNEWRCGHK